MQRVLCAVPGSGCDLLTQDGSSLCFCALTLFHWGAGTACRAGGKSLGLPGSWDMLWGEDGDKGQGRALPGCGCSAGSRGAAGCSIAVSSARTPSVPFLCPQPALNRVFKLLFKSCVVLNE